MRPESGSLSFGDDWAGVFIRGDNAMYYASQVTTMLNVLEEELGPDAYTHTRKALQELTHLLTSSHFNTRQLKTFAECLRE
jgi:hypothetical protein